ncbi:DEAD/DEAH box helicase [Tomitella fengzijianii]|uniref:DEAD/DEAH box helicase n=1 Tax=Tomitella fengzijianii TaxID=2597660 RepID=A0A516X2U3_9ACTN|nr:DEAD/DEAH box helicase [Tomitella fengzijianii]QDQ97373.1 DEAD/DEAH box helicase [Tomitella fengzijianii]
MTDSPTGDPSTHLDDFAVGLDFALDGFQRRSCRALEAGSGVLVCAPTGAGKTVVGEFAVHLALATGGKCFYTTPIKALSNQKFADLRARHGDGAVGLLTGDQSINARAPIVVMTTEVLRNMLYAQSPALDGLSHVVMDEVHFLADRFRGAVWEEVILGLPAEVRVVSLSATVSNAEEFGAWMQEVRGDTTVVVDEHRPVPLWQHVMVDGDILPLFEDDPDRSGRGVLVSGVLKRTVQHVVGGRPGGGDRGGPRGGAGRGSHGNRRGRGAQHGRGRSGRDMRSGGGGGGFRLPPRPHVIAGLDREGLLPAIGFIFSRAGCDGAVDQCRRSPLRLTTDDEAREIRSVIDRHTADLPREDLDILGFPGWAEALTRGFAAHHAGMLPVFRHAVEELFTRGLIRVVFATETLALGINMPARTVLLERLVKYNGETHADLTPGEYTQLTGRAGRRGIDIEGHAVIVWRPGMDLGAVAGLAGARTYPLKSSFQPGYNMTVNLVRRLGSREGRLLVERSFAQFQADRSVVGLARSIDRNREALEGYAQHLDCHLGDFREYAELRERIGRREKELETQTREARRRDVVEQLSSLRRGEVVAITSGRRSGIAVVLEPDRSATDPRPLVLNEDRWAGRVAATDFRGNVQTLGTMRLPKHVAHQSPQVRRDLAGALRQSGFTPPRKRPHGRKSAATDDRELADLRRRLRRHPCHDCPEIDTHSRWAERYFALQRSTDKLVARHNAAAHSLAREFDRMVRLLSELGYLAGSKTHDTTVTDAGMLLAGVYAESALLVTESLRRGLWTGLGPAELAAVVSALVYESRRGEGGVVLAGPERMRRALDDTASLWAEIREVESRHRLPETRRPDTGFALSVHRWVEGAPLDEVLFTAGDADGSPLAAGDFVRWCRQVVDLLDQVGIVSGDAELVSTARSAVGSIRRGVVVVEAP